MFSYIYYPFTAVYNMLYGEEHIVEREEPKIIKQQQIVNQFYLSKEELNKQISLLKKTKHIEYEKKSPLNLMDSIKSVDKKNFFQNKINTLKINDLNITSEEKRDRINKILKEQKEKKLYIEKMKKIEQNPILRKKYKNEIEDFYNQQKNDFTNFKL